LLQDLALELLELGAGREPELLVERPLCSPIRLERVGLTAGRVQRAHQLAVHPLAQRVFGDVPLELRYELCGTSRRKVIVDAVLENAQAFLVEAPARIVGESFLSQLD
jgi:hypothetical protein